MTVISIMASADCAVEYRDIPGFPGYRVGSDGTVWSRWRRHGKDLGKEWRLKKARVAKGGYLQLVLSRGTVGSTFRVHRLVTLAFIGPCPMGQEVNHKDGCKTNNAVENLEYVSRSENVSHAYRLGLCKCHLPAHPLPGEQNPKAKLTEEDVRRIRAMYGAGGESFRKLAKVFGVSDSQISRIISRQQWPDVADWAEGATK